jgi:tryptophan-rich sensory protein
MKAKKIFKFMLYVFSPLILGAIVGFLVDMDGFKTIQKPIFSPPGWLFPIVWSILYLLMGIGYYVAKNNGLSKEGERDYLIQLALNLLWSFIFFSFKWYGISAVWIIVLLYFVYKMFISFKETKKVAGYMQLPYIIWLLIALYLAIGVTILN